MVSLGLWIVNGLREIPSQWHSSPKARPQSNPIHSLKRCCVTANKSFLTCSCRQSVLLQSSIISRYNNQHFDISTQHQLWHLQTGMDNILVIQTSCLELTNTKIYLHRDRTYYARCKLMHLPHPTLYCRIQLLPHTSTEVWLALQKYLTEYLINCKPKPWWLYQTTE